MREKEEMEKRNKWPRTIIRIRCSRTGSAGTLGVNTNGGSGGDEIVQAVFWSSEPGK